MIFDVIVFPLAAFVLFRDLSHKNAWINHTILCFQEFLVCSGMMRQNPYFSKLVQKDRTVRQQSIWWVERKVCERHFLSYCRSSRRCLVLEESVRAWGLLRWIRRFAPWLDKLQFVIELNIVTYRTHFHVIVIQAFCFCVIVIVNCSK